MNKLNKKKQNSGGFLSALAGLFKGGAAAGGSVAGTAATGGIFATKAGILGLLLGGATIAAGAGAVYHFVGSATNTAYAPDLFQKSYLEEEAALAGAERSQSQDRHASINSSIGMFSAQAKKEGLGFEAREEEQQPEENSSASAQYSDEGSNASAAAADYSASSASAPRSSSNRLASKGLSSSFGSGGGSSSGASAPRMKSMGGLSGGINSKFASMKSASLAEGSHGNAQAMASAKKASISRGRTASARGARRSARSQAMFANAMGSKAAYSSSAAGARTSAESAFTGETTGSGDVAEGVLEGAGLGGAGLSMANELKSNDPSSSNSIKNVPKVSNPTDVSPWKNIEQAIAYLMLAGAALFALGSIFAKLAKHASDKWKAIWLGLTKGFAIALAAVGAAIIGLGVTMMIKYKQYLTGGIYALAGGIFVWKGASLWKEANNIEDQDTKKKMDQQIKDKQNEADAKYKKDHPEPTKPMSKEDYRDAHTRINKDTGRIEYLDDKENVISKDQYDANYNKLQDDYNNKHAEWQKGYDAEMEKQKIDVERGYKEGKGEYQVKDKDGNVTTKSDGKFHRGSIKNEINNDIKSYDQSTKIADPADADVQAIKGADGNPVQNGGEGAVKQPEAGGGNDGAVKGGTEVNKASEGVTGGGQNGDAGGAKPLDGANGDSQLGDTGGKLKDDTGLNGLLTEEDLLKNMMDEPTKQILAKATEQSEAALSDNPSPSSKA